MPLTPASPPTYSVCVDADKAGDRLDRFLAAALPGLSRRQVQELIAAGRVTAADGTRPTAADRRVRFGETFRIEVPPPPPSELAPQPMALTIVHEDDDILVLDKPPGLVVHPGAGTRNGTLVNALLARDPARLSTIGAPLRPGIVHRLDKDTSGLMVIARNDAAHHSLAAQFARHAVERVYLALCWGRPLPAEGVIEANIGRSPRDRKRMAPLAEGGKPARTRYGVVQAFPGEPGAALVACRPETGRTHQIRVHLAAIGHPLVGDAVYGRRRRAAGGDAMAALLAAFPRQALHAHVLAFDHPVSGARQRFVSPIPRDMNELVETLKTF